MSTSRSRPLALLLLTLCSADINAFSVSSRSSYPSCTARSASVAPAESSESSSSPPSIMASVILDQISAVASDAKSYSEEFDLGESVAGFYGLFDAMRKSGLSLGLKGQPFVLRDEDITKALDFGKSPFKDFYTISDLEKALEDDFLDAARGSTDNRKGWKIAAVSNTRGDSFEEARMTFQDVTSALEKGTVIFNAAGAHIPKLAGPSLACTDAMSLPNAINIYITAAGKRTSAPPHTDKQDVVVVQTSGRKHWKVFAPPDSSLSPMSDIFARGKGEDNLPLYSLEASDSLLLETTLNPGDVLFIPAAFPHTTSTTVDASTSDDTSVHLTFNFDSHVWDLDYLSARRLALRRGCVKDTALGQSRDEDNRYVGKANELPEDLRSDLFAELPIGFLDENPQEGEEATVDVIVEELKRISNEIDSDLTSAVDDGVWKSTVEKLREQGMELFEIHRDMYLAAIEEGRVRESEDAMTAHLEKSKRLTMSPERVQRLSLFRVQKYYEKINENKADLLEWSLSGESSSKAGAEGVATLPDNWAFTMPLKVGDQVEADLGGAFFPATVSRVAGSKYDVQFFDGDKDSGLERSMIKLLAPPNLAEEEDDVDTSNMTPKQLKRWKKEQQRKEK